MTKSKQPFTLTDVERRALAREIRYEADALQFSYEKTRPPASPPLDCLVLEAFLLHWRNLWYFFLEPRHKQDVIASDYVMDWNPERPDSALRDRIHTTLAHISKGRISAKALTAQEVRAMRDHIAGLWVAFDKALSPDKRCWFDDNPLKHKFPPQYRGPTSPLTACSDGSF